MSENYITTITPRSCFKTNVITLTPNMFQNIMLNQNMIPPCYSERPNREERRKKKER